MSQEQKNNSSTKPFTHAPHRHSYKSYHSRRSQSSQQSPHRQSYKSYQSHRSQSSQRSYNSYQTYQSNTNNHHNDHTSHTNISITPSQSSQSNSKNCFMQWIRVSEAHKRGVYMFNDKDPLHRAGMNEDLWTKSLLELFDKDNKIFFQIKQTHSHEQPRFSIDLYLAEEEDEIRRDCKLVKKHLKQDFDALALWHGRQLPLRLRKHVAARRSSTNWDKALQEAAKGFKYRTNLPQYELVNEILNDEMKETTGDNTRMQQKYNFDAWKKYKFDENYDRKYVKISYWLHYYIAQNVYCKFYVCPEWILAQMTFYLGKPIKSEYLNGQCETHKNGSSGKSMTGWPQYMYSQEECNECGCDDKSFIHEYAEPLKQQETQMAELLQTTKEIEQLEAETTFYVREAEKSRSKDPFVLMLGIKMFDDIQHHEFEQLHALLGRMGKKLLKGSETIEQWCLFVSGESINNPRKKIHQKYLESISQQLFALVKNIVVEIENSQKFQEILFALHVVFPAAPSSDYVWRFNGKFVRDQDSIAVPVSVMEVMINILHAYHLIMSWYQLHYATRNFWKVWLEWCWMADSLSDFIVFVRYHLRKYLLKTCGKCDKCQQLKTKYQDMDMTKDVTKDVTKATV